MAFKINNNLLLAPHEVPKDQYFSVPHTLIHNRRPKLGFTPDKVIVMNYEQPNIGHLLSDDHDSQPSDSAR
jgi:hypothetical protein